MIILTTSILVLTSATAFLMLYLPNLHTLAVKEKELADTSEQTGVSVLSLMRETDPGESGEETFDGQIRLQLPDYVDPADVTFETVPIEERIQVTIPNVGSNYFYDYPMVGSPDDIENVTFDFDGSVGTINFWMENVCELQQTIEGSYVYLTFVDPHDIYDYVVVIDAGHGGRAPGATKQGINEKDIDLAIVLKLKALFDDCEENIGVYYTRLDDTNPSLSSRVELANKSNADLFLSIHNNSTSSGRMSSIKGTEVMYRGSDQTGASKAFAQTCLDHLLFTLGSDSKGIVVGDDIYIIRTSEVPVALAEIGFMTNKEELFLLNSEDYQEKTAEALYQAILTSLENNSQGEEE